MPEPTKPDDKMPAARPAMGSVSTTPPPAPSKPSEPDPDAKQAALDKEAADLQAKADAEAAKAADLAENARKAEEAAEDHGQQKAKRCPQCHARMERYTGDNEHKAGTYVCPTHGRMRL